MNIDFNDLPEKNSITDDEVNNFIIFKKVNGQNIAFKTRLSIFEKFFINTSMLNNIRMVVGSFKADMDEYVKKLPTMDYVDANYLLKEDANFYRSKLLTADKLQSELGKYCTKEQVENDIEACRQHCRSVATSLANQLASIAATAKSANAVTAADTSNSADMSTKISEAIGSLGEAMKPAE